MKKYSLMLLILAGLLLAGCQKPDEDAKTGEPAVETAPEARTADAGITVPVEVLQVKKQTVRQSIPLTGTLAPRFSVDIVAEVSGKVTKVVKELGDRVTPADTLAFIDDRIPLSSYRQAQAQVISSQNNVKIAELNLESDKTLYEAGDISELAMETARLNHASAQAGLLAAEASLSQLQKMYEDTRIQTPLAGKVSRKYVEAGTMVNPNMPLYRVVDLSVMKVQVGVPQQLIALVQQGTRADVTISALDDRHFEGRVAYVSPQADEATGSFTVEIHIPNTAEQAILAGMTARIDLLLATPRKSVAIPEYAVVQRDGASFVYVVKGGRARLTPLNSRERFGAMVMVDEGLGEGDTLVVVGMKNLGLDTPVVIEKVNGSEE